MTALQIIRNLKADTRNILWINHERCEAAFMPHGVSCCTPVEFNDAKVARTDTNLRILEERDGEIIGAA